MSGNQSIHCIQPIWTVPRKHEQRAFCANRIGEHYGGLTNGFDGGHSSFCLLTSGPAPFLFCKSLSLVFASGKIGSGVVARGRSLVCQRRLGRPAVALVPGHALHEKGLQGPKGDGPLVSSQDEERVRPADKPRTNCWSNADFVPPSVYIGFRLFVLLKSRSGLLCSMPWVRAVVHDALGGTRDSCLLGEPFRRRPVLPGSAPPRCSAVGRPDPTRPWYVQVLDSTG